MSLASFPQEWAFAAWVIEIGNGPFGALSRMLCWSAGEGTHGYVPPEIAKSIASKSEVDVLLKNGRLEKVAAGEVREATGRIAHRKSERVVMPSDGYFIPDFLVYTQTVEEKERAREQRVRAGKGRAKQMWPDSGRYSGDGSGRSSSSSSSPTTTERRSTLTVDEALTEAAESGADAYPGAPEEPELDLDELVRTVRQ